MSNNRNNCIFPVNPYQNYYLQPYYRNHDRVLISFYEVRGEQICSKIEYAWNKVIERHDGLRLSFYQHGHEIYQVINQQVPFKINYHLDGADKSFAEIIEEYCLPFSFDLEKPPLFRVTLFYKDVNYYWMLLEIHHAIIDGTAAYVLFRDLFSYMQMHNLVEKFSTHYEYTVYLQNHLHSEVMEKQRKYWEDKLLAMPIYFCLPTDYQQKNMELTSIKPSFTFNIAGEFAQKIDLFVKESHMTRFAFFAGVFSLLLYEYSLCEEVVYISTVSQRKQAKFKEIVSNLVNFIAIKIKIDKDESISQFFKKNLQEIFSALANMEYPIAYIKEKIKLEQPIDSVIFLYQNFTGGIRSLVSEDSLASVNFMYSKSFGASRILRLEIDELLDGYHCNLSCNEKLFKNETVAYLLQRYQLLLEQVIVDKNLPIKTLIQSKDCMKMVTI
jgi:fengycin family lipopeptide synthetase D